MPLPVVLLESDWVFPLFFRVKKTLSSFPNVILITPSPDLNESIAISNERTGGFDFYEHFVKSRYNYELAKQTDFTKGKIPEETCEEIEKLLVHK